MAKATVSIIIPTLNRLNLLIHSLDSLKEQTFSAWEALVIDDGSDANTIQAIQEFSEKESRIKYVKRSRVKSGAPACRNEGFEISTGKYVIFLDSDDCLKSTTLKNRVAKMEAHPDIDFGVFPCLLFRQKPDDMDLLWNVDSEENDIDRFLAQDIPWQTTSPVWRRDSLSKLGMWDESLPSWQDWDFHLRALIYDLSYIKFDEPDCFWRIPDDGKEISSSIGKNSSNKVHLMSHRKLIIDTYLNLLEHKKMTQRRQDLISGLCIWVLDKLLFQNEVMEAQYTWDLYLDKRMIDGKTYSQGLFYINLIKYSQHSTFLRRAIRRGFLEYLKVFLPYEKHPYKQNLLRKIKVTA